MMGVRIAGACLSDRGDDAEINRLERRAAATLRRLREALLSVG
jgi:hypothetical protein